MKPKLKPRPQGVAQAPPTLQQLNTLADICAHAQGLSALIEGHLPGLSIKQDDRLLLLRAKASADMVVRTYRGGMDAAKWEDVLDAVGYMTSLQKHLARLDTDRKVLALQLLAILVDGHAACADLRRVVAAVYPATEQKGGGHD
jgi:hypothetical protein